MSSIENHIVKILNLGYPLLIRLVKVKVAKPSWAWALWICFFGSHQMSCPKSSHGEVVTRVLPPHKVIVSFIRHINGPFHLPNPNKMVTEYSYKQPKQNMLLCQTNNSIQQSGVCQINVILLPNKHQVSFLWNAYTCYYYYTIMHDVMRTQLICFFYSCGVYE